jgi:hypothetical protein
MTMAKRRKARKTRRTRKHTTTPKAKLTNVIKTLRAIKKQV